MSSEKQETSLTLKDTKVVYIVNVGFYGKCDKVPRVVGVYSSSKKAKEAVKKYFEEEEGISGLSYTIETWKMDQEADCCNAITINCY